MKLTYNSINKYDVYIENNILDHINDYYPFKNEKKLIITDDNIPSIYKEKIEKNLTNTYLYTFKNGEGSKTMETVLNILDFLVKNNFDRSDVIISLGGGVCSDICGFVSSIYKRGISLILIPTSTLGMVDASIGSKNGVDYKGIKNIFGTFYFPNIVLMDLQTLNTLDDRNYYNGLVEALKIGLLVDEKLYKLFLNNNIKENIQEIIYLSVKNKINIVQKDEIDSSLRMILNFGHTIGHALESMNNFDLYHGEAVAKGMLYMIEDSELKKNVIKIFEKMNIDCNLTYEKKINDYVLQDKKIRNGQLNLIKLHSLNDFYVKRIKVGDFDVNDL